MTEYTMATHLLGSALREAADVARTRLDRSVAVVDARPMESTAILRFDLRFAVGGQLSWFITNEDATGFSDLLIGGHGDRGAALTEMHLDALTAAFSDMLQRTVDSVSAGLSSPIEAGDLDLGMAEAVPALEPGVARVALTFDIDGFGALTIVQDADVALASFLEQHGVGGVDAAAADATPPAPAGPVAAGTQAAPVDGTHDNVVPLPQSMPAAARPQGDLDMLMNVPLPLTVELGHTQRTVRELVDFSIGSIIELGKLAGDPLDIKVNDRVIARGEVVVIDEEFGIRVTEIVSPEERLRGLG